LTAYKQFVDLAKYREYWYNQYVETPAILQATNWKKFHQRDNVEFKSPVGLTSVNLSNNYN